MDLELTPFRLIDSTIINAEEKIEIAKIKIRHRGQQLVAVVGDLNAADRIVGAWAKCSLDYFFCEFEITFADDFVFRGEYELWHKARKRPSFSGFISAYLLNCANAFERSSITLERINQRIGGSQVISITKFLETYAVQIE